MSNPNELIDTLQICLIFVFLFILKRTKNIENELSTYLLLGKS